ncbi:hypothetical protein ABLN72_06310, partial [Mycobacterium tuberculosis]
LYFVSVQIWVFNLQASQHFHCFAFIVKRFRVFRAPLIPALPLFFILSLKQPRFVRRFAGVHQADHGRIQRQEQLAEPHAGDPHVVRSY